MADQTVDPLDPRETAKSNTMPRFFLPENITFMPGKIPRRFRIQYLFISLFDFFFKREFPLLQSWTRDFFPCFGPDFAWSNFTLGSRPLATEFQLPETSLSPFFPPATRAVHWLLMKFSVYYASWYGHVTGFGIYRLPFGFDLHEMPSAEASTNRFLRAAGLPAARVISCVDQPGHRNGFMTVIMTRLPGEHLHTAYKELDQIGRETIKKEFGTYMKTLRALESPYGQKVCNVDGGPVLSRQLRDYPKEPCAFESEKVFLDFMFNSSAPYFGMAWETYEEVLEKAQRLLHGKEHRMVFSYGETVLNNVMIHNGHISGITEWGYAGFYPEYWDFQFESGFSDSDELKPFLDHLGREKYEKELEGLKALRLINCA